MKRTLAVVLALSVALLALAASAQRTGGSAGGSRGFGSSSSSGSSRSYGSSSSGSSRSYGSSSSSSSSSSRSYSSSSSSSSRSSSYSYSSSSSYGGSSSSSGSGWIIFGICCALLLGFVAWALITQSPGGSREYESPEPPGPDCELRRVSVAFDWTQRRELQGELEKLSASCDPSTESGLMALARTARDLVKRTPGARYAAWSSEAVYQGSAEAGFAKLANDARSRYEVETVSNARKTAGPEMTARTEEGAGFVVVTLVVGATQRLNPQPKGVTGEKLSSALSTLLPVNATQLAAFEVIWSPSKDEDRMSSAELEALYPELVKLEGAAGLGRIKCAYCGAVFAGELGECPSCGAKHEGAPDAKMPALPPSAGEGGASDEDDAAASRDQQGVLHELASGAGDCVLQRVTAVFQAQRVSSLRDSLSGAPRRPESARRALEFLRGSANAASAVSLESVRCRDDEVSSVVRKGAGRLRSRAPLARQQVDDVDTRGLVMVSVIVLVPRDAAALPAGRDRDALAQALGPLIAQASSIETCAVVFAPAEGGAKLRALTSAYPDLVRADQ